VLESLYRSSTRDGNPKSSTEKPTFAAETRCGLISVSEPAVGFSSATTIVFVHGLGGCAYGTWTHDRSKEFWPAWLSDVKGLETARVMTYGYDASWNKTWKANTVLDIPDFARQLVNDLWLYYLERGNVLFPKRASLTS